MAGAVARTKFDERWRKMRASERKLRGRTTTERHFDPVRIADELASYRDACDALIFMDFDFACEKNIDGVLWDVHTTINSGFRVQLNRFKKGEGRSRIVEQRKLTKSYLGFIKASQAYYRGYIQRLASRFGPLPELQEVASRFDAEDVSSGMRGELEPWMPEKLLLSCHQALTRLGDLSRYRELERGPGERNWGPAVGYYDLAAAVRPSSGTSHNQLAVIALADGDQFRSTYHLYRAVAVKEPFPTARENLELLFKKVLQTARTARPTSETETRIEQQQQQQHEAFLRLHARYYKGVAFPDHDGLEDAALASLVADLKDDPASGHAPRIVLTNIAAQYLAEQRLRSSSSPSSSSSSSSLASPMTPEEATRSVFSFIRLNARTFTALLRLLRLELQDARREDPRGTATTSTSDAARRVLPCLRDYSSWLMSYVPVLSADLDALAPGSDLGQHVGNLWRAYSETLTLLTWTFSIDELPVVDHLLPEDEETLGFEPFSKQMERGQSGRYLAADGTPKRTFHAKGVSRHHPKVETLGRVRDFLSDGMSLVISPDAPLELRVTADGPIFVYSKDPPLVPDVPDAPASPGSDRTMDEATETAPPPESPDADDTGMNDMVDDLVGSQADDEARQHPAAAGTPPAPARVNTPPSYSFDDSPFATGPDDGPAPVIGSSSKPSADGARSRPRSVQDTTDYSLIGASTANALYDDLSILRNGGGAASPTSPFAPDPRSPAFAPSCIVPQQQQQQHLSVDSSVSTMSDATRPLPSPRRGAKGRRPQR